MNRAQAWDLLCEFTASDSLRKHGLLPGSIAKRSAA